MRQLCRLLLLFLGVTAASQSPPAPDPKVLEEHARTILTEARRDKNPDTRKQAAEALSLGGAREPFMSDLEAMLADKDVEVRLAVVAGLADLKTERARKLLRQAMDDEVPEVGFAAARSLYALNDPEGKTALLSVLSGESKVASGFITKQKRDAMRMLHTPRTLVLFALKQGMGLAPVPGLSEGISSMQGILSDPGVSGRALAALMLGKEKDAGTLAALREALADKDGSVRAAAVHSLALRNDPALRKDLEPLLDDKKQPVRLRAAAGYLRLGMLARARRVTRSKAPA